MAIKQYSVTFWGGPRCGDAAFQIERPVDNYYIPYTNEFDESILRTPVSAVKTKELCHHYECKWVTKLFVQYRYKGITTPGE